MAEKDAMLKPDDVRKRAHASFGRNWRRWAGALATGQLETPSLTVSLHAPRESDLQTSEQIASAREWVECWRGCTLPGVEWQQRSWARVGNQSIPVRVHVEGADQIALWAGESALWEKALSRTRDIRKRLDSEWNNSIREASVERPDDMGDHCAKMAIADAVRLSIADWCALDEEDWGTALLVWDWLLAHPHEACYVRQLPIRGIDTKWIEQHGKALRELYRALAGHDFAFTQPAKQFRCIACCPELQLCGCDEFSLSAAQLAKLNLRPKAVVICENLMNTLCLHDLPGTLAIHGSGFAVTELAVVPWLAETPILYWGDLDSNGFAILNALRSIAPHARSIMMDAHTLNRHLDLCVDEPKPATGSFDRLTPDEHETLHLLAQGDPTRSITNLRLEQERIEWTWAYTQIKKAKALALDALTGVAEGALSA